MFLLLPTFLFLSQAFIDDLLLYEVICAFLPNFNFVIVFRSSIKSVLELLELFSLSIVQLLNVDIQKFDWVNIYFIVAQSLWLHLLWHMLRNRKHVLGWRLNLFLLYLFILRQLLYLINWVLSIFIRLHWVVLQLGLNYVALILNDFKLCRTICNMESIVELTCLLFAILVRRSALDALFVIGIL